MDRCDRCGSAGMVIAMNREGKTLTLCLHHSREHAAALARAGFDTIEDTEAIAALAVAH